MAILFFAFAQATNVKFASKGWTQFADSMLVIFLVVGLGLVAASILLSWIAARRTTFRPEDHM